ncbi:bZIP transcription factor [Halorubrum tibetense]|uniref:BZIP transcription factor n=1 Tax=Halorubrum tibetense TaxID=175631 RepID=A0ABD5S8A3_9EURY
MVLALPVDAEDIFDALFLSVMTLVGFLGGGLIGLVIGFAAGYAYITWTDRIADLEATVNALIKEKETLRRRVDELEADDGRGDRVTDGGVDAPDGDGT